jgi:hypothetical protein
LSERVIREGAVVGEAFVLEESGIDVAPDRPETVEVGDVPADAEVTGVVEGLFRAQGAAFLEVLLELGVPVSRRARISSVVVSHRFDNRDG